MFLGIINTIRRKRKIKMFKRNSILNGTKYSFGRAAYVSLMDGSVPEDVQIGDNFTLNGALQSQNGGKIFIGDNVWIGENSCIQSVESVSIKGYCRISNNVFITDSMDILGKVTSNEIYREIMINTINYIGRGEKISSAFQGHWAIPEVAYYMMVTGESTGELAEMMGKVSDYYAEQHKMIVDSLKTLIEPMLIIFLAVVVGGIMIAVIVPMFSLYQEIL